MILRFVKVTLKRSDEETYENRLKKLNKKERSLHSIFAHKTEKIRKEALKSETRVQV